LTWANHGKSVCDEGLAELGEHVLERGFGFGVVPRLGLPADSHVIGVVAVQGVQMMTSDWTSIPNGTVRSTAFGRRLRACPRRRPPLVKDQKRVLVVGGTTAELYDAVSATWTPAGLNQYDPATGRFTPTASMPGGSPPPPFCATGRSWSPAATTAAGNCAAPSGTCQPAVAGPRPAR
jgi:hypothetical protein